MRDFPEKSVDQARKAFDAFMTAAYGTANALEGQAAAARKGSEDVLSRANLDVTGRSAPIVSDVGDGNFHPLILTDPDNPEEMRRAKDVNARLISRATALKDTSMGEHGIGIGKLEFICPEHGEAVDVIRAIKLALGPLGIVSPGRILHVAVDAAELAIA